jgi:hypothetical protein
MATTDQLTAWLADAEAKYHSLATGGSVKVFVDQNGERIEYTAANKATLAAYINELKRQLGLLPVTGPMMIVF